VRGYVSKIDRSVQPYGLVAHMSAEEMTMTHVIGPDTAHKYHPDAKVAIDRLIDAIAERGRDPYPRKIRFATWTLAYNRMKWVTIDGLGKHWKLFSRPSACLIYRYHRAQ
jgi:hypothetical protein